MDNNYNGFDYRDNDNYQRPRKKVSRATLRKRQLGGLTVIAFVVLMIVIVTAKACSKDSVKKGGDKTPTGTNTVASTTTPDVSNNTITTTTTVTTLAEPTNPPDIGFGLTRTTAYYTVGQSEYAAIVIEDPSSADPNAVWTWTSSNTEIAIVNNIGMVTALAPGECYVTVSTSQYPSKEAMIKIVVTGSGGITQTSATTTTVPPNNLVNTTTTPAEPQPLTEAPAPPRLNIDGVHYEGNTLIVNKSYSLPASYAPGGLEATTQAWFNKLVQGAAKDNINIYNSSGYRSYDYQQQIYNNYVTIYGTNTADTFSARPGHSEHQTGMAIDCNIISDEFIGTPEAKWLAAHCHEYGFIIRYPQGKQNITGYKYEPWHIRYVGTEISYRIHNLGEGATLEELFNIDSQYKQ